MFTLNQRDIKEYPGEKVEKWKAAAHQIVSLPMKDCQLRPESAVQTLLKQFGMQGNNNVVEHGFIGWNTDYRDEGYSGQRDTM